MDDKGQNYIAGYWTDNFKREMKQFFKTWDDVTREIKDELWRKFKVFVLLLLLILLIWYTNLTDILFILFFCREELIGQILVPRMAKRLGRRATRKGRC